MSLYYIKLFAPFEDLPYFNFIRAVVLLSVKCMVVSFWNRLFQKLTTMHLIKALSPTEIQSPCRMHLFFRTL